MPNDTKVLKINKIERNIWASQRYLRDLCPRNQADEIAGEETYLRNQKSAFNALAEDLNLPNRY